MMTKMKPRNEKKSPAIAISLTIAVMYVVSAVFLLLLAFLLYQMELTEEVVKIGIIVIYIISGFSGGFLIGKQMKDKRYLWGLLAGVIYYALILMFSLLLKQGMTEEMVIDPIRIVTTLFLCAASGMAGGLVS